jgi:hypothetical protein
MIPPALRKVRRLLDEMSDGDLLMAPPGTGGRLYDNANVLAKSTANLNRIGGPIDQPINIDQCKQPMRRS